MITLNKPIEVNAEIGGDAVVSYDVLVPDQITYIPKDRTANGLVSIRSTANADAPVISGRFRMDVGAGVFTMEVERLGIDLRIRLSPQGAGAVQSIITGAQTAVENGFLALAAVRGVQSPGV